MDSMSEDVAKATKPQNCEPHEQEHETSISKEKEEEDIKSSGVNRIGCSNVKRQNIKGLDYKVPMKSQGFYQITPLDLI